MTALLTVFFVGAAGAETYICKAKPDGHDLGWISKTIVIDIDDKTSEVLVRDSVIMGYMERPVSGHISTNTPKRLTVTWEVIGAKDVKNNNIPRFLYRATILKARGNKIIIKAQPSGFFKSLGGSGKCELRK